MSTSPIDLKTGSDREEKIDNGENIFPDVVAVSAIAEDTVEAAHQCTLGFSLGAAI